MKKFLLVLLVVLIAITVLAACASLVQTERDIEQDLSHYTEKLPKALPGWVIIIGAIALFFIGFGLIWKLIPGFIKFIALIVLAAIVAGVAYGVWQIPIVDRAIDKVDTYMEQQQNE